MFYGFEYCECYFCENFSQIEDEEKCCINDCPNYGKSQCDDFIGKKKGDVFYSEGKLYLADYTLTGDKGTLRLKFGLSTVVTASYEIETDDINLIPKNYLDQTWLLELQPRYGRDGNIINLVNRVFIPFKKEEV